MTVSRSSVGKSEPDNDTGGALPKFIGGVVKSEYFSVILESDKKGLFDCKFRRGDKTDRNRNYNLFQAFKRRIFNLHK